MSQYLLLDADFGQEQEELNLASKGKRFVNYIMDTIVSLFFTSIILQNIGEEGFFGTKIFFFLSTSLLPFFYYFLMEVLLKGKTLGKFITGTRAVASDGSPMDTRSVAIRSISRIVPFEAFSFLRSGLTGWHDDWSDTVVIDEK